MKERNALIIKLLASHILLAPLLLAAIIGFNLYWFPAILITQTVLLILFFAGYWEFFGIRNKWLICILLELMILTTVFVGMSSEQGATGGLVFLALLSLAELYLLFMLGKIIWVIIRDDKENVEIEFPFRDGAYLITDGGNSEISRLMNYHFHSTVHKRKNTNRSMLYATDIVRTGSGNKKFMPPENSDYPIFGENVYCPMDGVVFRVVNDIEENIPYSGNYPYNTGNTVVIKNGGYYLLAGHLKKGTITVKPGDTVKAKDKLGESGNSGMSERPHLHMQLIRCDGDDYWKGTGINMQFRGKNLYKNRLIRN